jgi:hypothetical protein
MYFSWDNIQSDYLRCQRISFNALIKEGLAPSMSILHLSVFNPNQLSVLYVPEEKQKKDSMIR